MAINKRGFKSFQAASGSAEELNRVQQAVSEAIRRLSDEVDVEISSNPGPPGPAGTNGTNGTNGTDGADGVWAPPAVGTVPSGFTWMYTWSGTNTANALRHFNANNAGSSIDANSSEVRFQVPFAGTFQTMLLTLSAGFPSGADKHTRFTLRKNGVGNDAAQDTALEINLDSDVDAGVVVASDLTHSVHFNRGDWAGVTYYEVNMGGAMSATCFCNIFFIAD